MAHSHPSSITPTLTNDSLSLSSTIATEQDRDPMDKNAQEEEPDVSQLVPLASPGLVDSSLSDRIRRIAAVAWTQEQDDNMMAERRQAIHHLLTQLETTLDEDDQQVNSRRPGLARTDVEVQCDFAARNVSIGADVQTSHDEVEDDDEWIDEADIIAVRHNLASTVASMRLRQQEQQHLHELTTRKLESVAQRCLVQEKQLQDLTEEVGSLRDENQTLGRDNDHLHTVMANLENEASRREVAVSAMSSAVSGLQGWIESTDRSRDQTPTPTRHDRRQRMVMRGKGRFRGRYLVDEHRLEGGDEHSVEVLGDADELHDGVKAWLRGFKDVEEELRQSSSPAPKSVKGLRQTAHVYDEEWGDFQSPQ